MKKDLQQGKQTASQEILSSFDIFPWISSFETGVDLMDEQHKMLVLLLNSLARDLAHHSDALSFDDIFQELGAYAVYHFDAEESLMRDFLAGDSLEAGHQQAHRLFVEEIERLKRHSKEKPAIKSVEEIVVFLTRWLANHILETDRRMAKIVLAVQTGVPLAEAKSQAELYMTGPIRELNDAVLGMYAKLSTRTFTLMKELTGGKEEGPQFQPLQIVEWEHIQRALLEHDGNISATARTLNMHRRTLQRKLRKPPEAP